MRKRDNAGETFLYACRTSKRPFIRFYRILHVIFDESEIKKHFECRKMEKNTLQPRLLWSTLGRPRGSSQSFLEVKKGPHPKCGFFREFRFYFHFTQ